MANGHYLLGRRSEPQQTNLPLHSHARVSVQCTVSTSSAGLEVLTPTKPRYAAGHLATRTGFTSVLEPDTLPTEQQKKTEAILLSFRACSSSSFAQVKRQEWRHAGSWALIFRCSKRFAVYLVQYWVAFEIFIARGTSQYPGACLNMSYTGGKCKSH